MRDMADCTAGQHAIFAEERGQDPYFGRTGVLGGVSDFTFGTWIKGKEIMITETSSRFFFTG